MNGSSDPQGERKGKCSLSRPIVDNHGGQEGIIRLIAMRVPRACWSRIPGKIRSKKKEDRGEA